MGTLLAVLLVPGIGFAATLTVDAQANIFGAGHSAPPAPGAGGAGILPPAFSFGVVSGGGIIFTSVTGMVSCCIGVPGTFTGPDGGTPVAPFSSNTNISSYGGVSGIQFTDRQMFMVGVFLNSSEPVDPAPASLSYASGGGTDLYYYPLLNQIFFIGDGLTGTGTGSNQIFFIPAGATRMYLGFADMQGFLGGPGWYGDNVNHLSSPAGLTATFLLSMPEPGAGLLVALGLAALAVARLRRA